MGAYRAIPHAVPAAQSLKLNPTGVIQIAEGWELPTEPQDRHESRSGKLRKIARAIRLPQASSSSSELFHKTRKFLIKKLSSDIPTPHTAAPGSDYFSNGNSTYLVAPNQVHDRFPIPSLECTRIPTNISRAEPPRQDDRSEVRRRRLRLEEGEE
ncbi:dipeptidyl peptidase 9 [Dorcoceras hygrometricum]|uniref:Dipeptidyl peptidase 9 n=1 Tax=Dorcoceras hygrometricum TaxID=472368 RepID=A0A2Z7AWP0_9LAMI|nr:dipeptidyl peptidase 9 [Dorcoceras hygrometricum]